MVHEEPKKEDTSVLGLVCVMALFVGILGTFSGIVYISVQSVGPIPVPDVELASMDFTVLNITETRLSAKWDLSIRIPYDLPSYYICLQGDLQASFFYKNITLATSSPQKYYNLQQGEPQILAVSASVSEEDIGGLIVKDIMEDIKERKEVKFGSQFFLTDCRKKTRGMLSYACDEATLRFEPRSEMKATVFGNQYPRCINF